MFDQSLYEDNEELNLESKLLNCVFLFDMLRIFSMEVFVVEYVEINEKIFDNIMIDHAQVMKSRSDNDHVFEEQQSF